MTKKKNHQKQAKSSTSSIHSPQPSTSSEIPIPHENLIREIVHSKLFHICLSDMIYKCIESIQDKLSELSTKMAEIDESLSSHQEAINELADELRQLRSTPINSPLSKVNDNGTYLLRIHGLTAESNDICNSFHSIVSTKLGITCDSNEFSTVGAHDESVKSNNRGTTVTIQLEDQDLWTKIYRARTMLKGTSIYISEVLSNSNQFLFYLSRRMKKDNRISATWTYKGQIYIRTHEENILEIKSPSDLSIY